MLTEIVNLSQGNPGAMTFLMDLANNVDGNSVVIFSTLQKTSIRGTDIYVLWSDLCNKDRNKVAKLCNDCPESVLIDACSRQDYSGIELVKDYF